MSRKVRAHIFLFTTALIWGTAFVAQKVAMDHIGPFTFNGIRMFVGGVALIAPALLLSHKGNTLAEDMGSAKINTGNDKKTLYIGGLCCGVAFFFGSAVQQVGLQYTTPGKAGFITALYIIIVPLLGLLMKKRVSKVIWFCVILATVGVYFLSMDNDFTMNRGDFLMLFSALGYAMHIIVIDYFSPKADGIKLSCLQCFVCAFISFVPMFIFESPNISSILTAWFPILYTGVISGGIAYTLQIVAQKDTTPTITALILSFESVFAVLAGIVLLHLFPIPKEIFGCVLMFTAIVLAQLPEKSVENKLKGEI